MVQTLLADRFQLTFHRDKKELSVYAIAVAKTEQSSPRPKGIRTAFPALAEDPVA